MIKIAILGCGTVGSGVVELLYKNAECMSQTTGERIECKWILDRKDLPQYQKEGKLTKEFADILEDEEVSVVCETMGGLEPAYSYTKALLKKGKSVVSSNKELVSQKGTELLALARKHQVNYFFEASVGGAIPVVGPLYRDLKANHIQSIVGILNGTTNFILTKMVEEQHSFEKALQSASDLGYAEQDPSADVEGQDACRKICILASLAYGKEILPQQVHAEGITRLTLADVAYAASWGKTIKLVSYAKEQKDGKIVVLTAPMLLSKTHPLAEINDVFNGVCLEGNMSGRVVLIGRGAGKAPTASAVVGDVIAAVLATKNAPALFWEKPESPVTAPLQEFPMQFYCRVKAKDGISDQILSQHTEIIHILHSDDQAGNEAAFITHFINENILDGLQTKLAKQGIQIVSRIRVLQEDCYDKD